MENEVVETRLDDAKKEKKTDKQQNNMYVKSKEVIFRVVVKRK